jgi:hypothetical protein
MEIGGHYVDGIVRPNISRPKKRRRSCFNMRGVAHVMQTGFALVVTTNDMLESRSFCLAVFAIFFHLPSFGRLLHHPTEELFVIGAHRFVLEINFVIRCSSRR